VLPALLVGAAVMVGTASAGSVTGIWKRQLLDSQLTGPDVPSPEGARIRDSRSRR